MAAHRRTAMENDQDEAQKRTAVACTLAVVTAALAVATQNSLLPTPIPMRTSILSGQMWLDELLVGHPGRFREQFGMSRSAFQLLSRELQLHSGLVDRRHVTQMNSSQRSSTLQGQDLAQGSFKNAFSEVLQR